MRLNVLSINSISMRRFLFLAFALLAGMCAAAQDIVVMRDGRWVKTSHLSSSAGKYFYIEEGDTTMRLNELKRSEIGMILYANGRVKHFNELQSDPFRAPFASETEGEQVDVERMYRDYRAAVRLKNTGLALTVSGSVLTLSGVAMTLMFGMPMVALFYIGPGLLVAGVPCWIVGANRVDMMDFSMRQMMSVPVVRSGRLGMNLTGGGGTTGLSLTF